MTDRPATSREQFVGRVRDALASRGRGGATAAPPAVDDATARITSDADDLATLFIERAAALGITVVTCEPATLAATIAEQLDELGARRIALAIDDLPNAQAIAAELAERGVVSGDWRRDPAMDAAFEADAGVTTVAAAVAETGSLIYEGDAQHARGLMLAPPAHVAVVRRRQLIPDLLDHARRLDATPPDDLPAGQVVISGPSKTADIEGILITGVHGPGTLVVLFVSD